ncbi:restriction endonuclease subunit S [Prevotella fusca]
MREGWEYKKFECCIVKAPKVKQVKKEAYNNGSRYPIISQEDKFISGYCDDETMVCHIDRPIIVFGDHTRVLKYIDFDFVVGADGVKIIIPTKDIDSKFLLYFLQWYNVPNLGYSRHYKLLKDITVPIPDSITQLSIVSEFDKINELIRIKKEQLKDYDTLAQSIFYEMFGDPVENEKGWGVKQLKDVSTLLNGRAYKQQELLDKGKYKVLRVGNFFTNSNYYYSDLELDDDRYCEYGDLLFAWSASFGAFIWGGDKVIYHYHIWKVLFEKGSLNIQYYRYLLNTMTSFFMNDVHGIGMVHLTKSGMEQYKLPLPPLSLQQSFAHKIEQIEKQKAALQNTITDLETLLASRMQYWFG